MRIKICGITSLEQGSAIAQLGANALGFICVKKSPRYLSPDAIATITPHLPPQVSRIGVFANTEAAEIISIVQQTHLTAVQLHGEETEDYCNQLRSQLPNLELIKAIRVKSADSLQHLENYAPFVDTFLLDAYDPKQLGGTGKTFNWEYLQNFNPPRPWFLAGGLTPDNIQEALAIATPNGIDLSSGVETSPGNKDLGLVKALLQAVVARSPLK